MSRMPSTVEIAIHDLSDSLDKLNKSRLSPSDTRRNFYRFVNSSQKITSYMRREYKKRKNKKWEARTFNGWNSVTDLFKELRNLDEHSEPIVLRINYTWHYEGLVKDGSATIGITGHWEGDNPLDEFPYDALEASAPNFEKGGIIETVKAKQIEYEYVLFNKQKKIDDLLKNIGYSDIHKLSNACFDTIESYFKYYCEELAK